MAPRVASLEQAAFPLFLHGVRGLRRFPAARRALFGAAERSLRRRASRRPDPRNPPGVEADRLSLRLAFLRLAERVLAGDRLQGATLRGLLQNLLGLLVRSGEADAKVRFRAEHGCRPPDFLVLSPGKACNLRCTGCYAAAGPAPEKLDWSTLNAVVRQAHDLWGARFFVLSGGEPLRYEDEGKGVLDLAEGHPDCFFVMYTNGTLVTDAVARRLGRIGNLSPALSVEGLQERTDARRGKGVFSRVLAAMERLRGEKVLYGLSLTATRENAEEVLSDELLDLLVEERGALYAFVFHYMPIGRAFGLDLMLTPRQRFSLWRRVWEVVRERRLVVLDFWNSGTASNGCIAAGRAGGYFHVNWNGNASPCVFIPFSPVNVKDLLARGGSLADVWASPFFQDIRAWQRRYGYREPGERYEGGGNWLLPCLIRDHHQDFCRILERHQPAPTDDDARALRDEAAYHEGLERFDRELAALADPVWEERYCPAASTGGD
jgi:MoaA/NifB/PqqE/SkfB family radical SAM enzyme